MLALAGGGSLGSVHACLIPEDDTYVLTEQDAW